jgi:hypothetical protein
MEIFTITPNKIYNEDIETKTFINEFELGKEKRRNDWPIGTVNAVEKAYAKRSFRLNYAVLTQVKYALILDFFQTRIGMRDAFWFENFNESPITKLFPSYIIIDSNYAAADTTTLAHYPIIADTQTIYDDGAALVENTDYTIISATGVITWLIKPANGSILTANYRFYREVRFDEDKLSPKHLNFELYTLDVLLKEIAPRL